MNKTELKAVQWLINERGLKLGEIRKRPDSPDFETPIGDFEIKKLYSNTIVFYPPQLNQLSKRGATTILVFNEGEQPVAQIPFHTLDFASGSWNNFRLVLAGGRQIRLNEDIYLQLDDFRGKRETFSQAIERLLKLHRMMKETT